MEAWKPSWPRWRRKRGPAQQRRWALQPHLVLGGASSRRSSHAERLAELIGRDLGGVEAFATAFRPVPPNLAADGLGCRQRRGQAGGHKHPQQDNPLMKNCVDAPEPPFWAWTCGARVLPELPKPTQGLHPSVPGLGQLGVGLFPIGRRDGPGGKRGPSGRAHSEATRVCVTSRMTRA